MNGTQALGAPVACVATAGTATAAATCTASASPALSNVPPGFLNPSRVPRVPPAAPLALVTCTLALLLFASMRRSGIPGGRRLGYALACALVITSIAVGFAGCGGGSSGGGGTTPTTHVDSITAVYSGDSTYVGSTSPAVAVTVSNQ
jgi:hypothetical protein